MVLLEELKTALVESLKGLTDSDVEFLNQLGLLELEDLKFLSQDDLTPHFNVIASRKIIKLGNVGKF